MKKSISAAAFVVILAACEPTSERVFFQEPSRTQLAGVWSGIEEITTDDDIAANSTYGDYGRGFNFPVVLQFDGHGRFTLYTGNFPASSYDESDRTCRGVYTQTNATLRLLPDEQCRALPLLTYTVGRRLPNGITLDARTGTSLSSLASYASYRVTFRLEKD